MSLPLLLPSERGTRYRHIIVFVKAWKHERIELRSTYHMHSSDKKIKQSIYAMVYYQLPNCPCINDRSTSKNWAIKKQFPFTQLSFGQYVIPHPIVRETTFPPALRTALLQSVAVHFKCRFLQKFVISLKYNAIWFLLNLLRLWCCRKHWSRGKRVHKNNLPFVCEVSEKNG